MIGQMLNIGPDNQPILIMCTFINIQFQNLCSSDSVEIHNKTYCMIKVNWSVQRSDPEIVMF